MGQRDRPPLRHLGLFLVAISQQLSDFAGPHGRALLGNSTQRLFLRQSPDELAYIKDAVRLSDAEVAAIARLKTVVRLLAGLLDQRHPRRRHDRSARRSHRVRTRHLQTPSATSPRRTQLLDAEHGDAWRALERLATEAGTPDARAREAAGAVVAGRDLLPRLLAVLGATLAGLLLLVMAPLTLVSSGGGAASAPVRAGSARFVAVYREAARVFGVDWLVLASVHAQETGFSSTRPHTAG